MEWCCVQGGRRECRARRWVVVEEGLAAPKPSSPLLAVSAITDLSLSQEEGRWPRV